MASGNVKKPCGTCQKSAGVATCDGCQQSFCSKHFVEHRQELSQEMDNIGQVHDLLRRDLDQHNREISLFSRINTWEQESIAKIQIAAEAARADLHELFDKNKKELRKSVTKITGELQACRESDDYTEIDINKWTEQLRELRKMLEFPSAIVVDENETPKSIIRLIRVRDQQQHRLPNSTAGSLQHRFSAITKLTTSFSERFDKTVGKVRVSEENLMVTCQADSIFLNPICYGANEYQSGRHRIDFRIERIGSRNLFFGITTSFVKLKRDYTHDQALYGWWDFVKMVVQGNIERLSSNKFIKTGDEMTLVLDCDNRQIQLQHHRTNELRELAIDINNCPFPRKIVVKLKSSDDSVRILP